MCESIASTSFLLSLQSIYYMNRFKWTKAEELCQKALDMDPLNQNLLFNMCTIQKYKGSQSDLVQSTFISAYNYDPSHILSKEYDQKNAEFDQLCLSFSTKT
uniref:Coatomer subunit epsilon n=1 Tax=Henneguya salminicola TaxID=69463 RepID=A0A6G3MNE8_HENSL